MGAHWTNITYSDEAFDHEKLINNAARNLDGIKFESMVGTGLSGALVIPLLAQEFDVPFALIRKNVHNSHALRIWEGTITDNWLFVDDFISTGSTAYNVMNAVWNITRGEAHPVGAYLYSETYAFPNEVYRSIEELKTSYPQLRQIK